MPIVTRPGAAGHVTEGAQTCLFLQPDPGDDIGRAIGEGRDETAMDHREGLDPAPARYRLEGELAAAQLGQTGSGKWIQWVQFWQR